MILLDITDSTNNYIKRNIETLNDREIVIAERQTGGRGRFGRSFVSDCGGLYMSILLKDYTADLLTVRGGISAADVIADIGGDPKIKWVNDVYCEGKKVCGILAEAINGCAVVGIGVNISNTDSLPDVASSLEKLYGINIDPVELGSMIADKFFAYLNDNNAIWRYRCYTSHMIGRYITYNNGGGTVMGVTDNGNLRITGGGGEEIILNSGEISIKI